MNQKWNRRSVSSATTRLWVPLLCIWMSTTLAIPSTMGQGLFLDVTKVSEPGTNSARSALGRSADSWTLSPHDEIRPLPLRLSIVQFESRNCRNGDSLIVIIDVQNDTDHTVLFPATRDNSFDTSAPGNIVATLRLVIGDGKTPINRFLILFGSNTRPSSTIKIPAHRSLRIKAPLEIKIPDPGFIGNSKAKSFIVAVSLGFLRGPMTMNRKVESDFVDLVCHP